MTLKRIKTHKKLIKEYLKKKKRGTKIFTNIKNI